jgi:hypothetical protein
VLYLAHPPLRAGATLGLGRSLSASICSGEKLIVCVEWCAALMKPMPDARIQLQHEDVHLMFLKGSLVTISSITCVIGSLRIDIVASLGRFTSALTGSLPRLLSNLTPYHTYHDRLDGWPQRNWMITSTLTIRSLRQLLLRSCYLQGHIHPSPERTYTTYGHFILWDNC